VTRPVYLCDYVRTPIGRYGGALATVRPDDLAALTLKALVARNTAADWSALDDVILGCVNQAGEDNRNVARMAVLLAGLPVEVPGTTINRLCGSGMDAMLVAARQIAAGEADLVIAGGVESMSRAPFVLGKAEQGFSRAAELQDTTMGWRFVNPQLESEYGAEAMPRTAENIAEEKGIGREEQDAFALASQQRAEAAWDAGLFADEVVEVAVPQRRGDPVVFSCDEHMRPDADAASLARLKPLYGSGGTVTAGNSSGLNDGAAALLLASEEAMTAHGLTPIARVVGGATAGVAPRVMGMGPVPASRKLLTRLALGMDDFAVLEFNEAFAVQVIACARALGLAEDDPRLNRRGGAIALGHPLGMSGARIAGTAACDLQRSGERYALAAMCIGVGQGIALALERP
jgi:acetyl-CoA C-acetyltransferase/acetyl-CoA acyltransferase